MMAPQSATNGEIFIADDDECVRDALSMILTHAGYSVSGFADGETLLAAMQTREPACVLLDVQMPGSSGLDVLRKLSARKCAAPVIMISGDNDVALVVDAIKNEAFDYIMKPFDGPGVVARVGGAVAAGAKRHSNGKGKDDAAYDFPGWDLLTPRESEVLAQVAGGASNKEAGRRLGISPRTIEVHRARIMCKLGARNAADLVRIVFSGTTDRNEYLLALSRELVA